MELEHIVKKAVRRWAEKIASKRAQRQARMALPNGSDLSKRKAGRLGVAGSVAGHIEEITVAESQPEAFTRPTSRKAEAHDAKDNAPAHLDHRLAAFAEERYDLRHNLLTGQAEFRPKGQDAAAFLPLTARDLNSLCLTAHEAGIPCWDRDVSRFVDSDRLLDYHPFRDYFDRLPPWDGEDRLNALARRVSDSALWVSGFRRWMLAVAAQWMGIGDGYANSMAPTPDMKLPIQYALYYPERRFLAGDRLDFAALTQITFEEPDMDTFLGLPMAMQASRTGGSMPTVFNAANERAVALFLAKKIRFLEIYDVIAGAMEAHKTIADPTLEQILAAEQETYEWIANRYKMGE